MTTTFALILSVAAADGFAANFFIAGGMSAEQCERQVIDWQIPGREDVVRALCVEE